MIHRAAAPAKIQHICQCPGNILLCQPDRLRQPAALGQIAGNGGGQGTARPVGVGIINALPGKPGQFPILIQEVIGIIDTVTTF